MDASWKFSRVIFFLLVIGVFVGLVQLLRYGSTLGEIDSAAFLRSISIVQKTGELAPSTGGAYTNGYGYPALALFFADLSAISLGQVQLVGGALLLAWIVLPAWLSYREFTRSELAASLATLILLAQPEFIFPLLRGTHEKFTRGLMFLCLYLLLRSLRSRGARQLALLVVTFYLSGYALITFNNLLASSFITALVFAVTLVWSLGRLRVPADWHRPQLVSRLGYVIASLLVMAFIFTFYAYTPAQHQIQVLQSIADRLSVLFLQVEEASSNPYVVVNRGWISPAVYFAVSLANWLLLATSVLIWFAQARRWRQQRQAPPAHLLLLWAFYAAFVFQGVVSMAIDISGAIAKNLQHRAFPSFVMLATPLVGHWLAQRLKSPQGGWLQDSRALRWGLGAGVAVLMALSLLKATVEPALSNYWIFYTPGEYQAAAWSERALVNGSLWVGFNERVAVGYALRTDGRAMEVYLDTYTVDPYTRDFLLSQATLLHASRVNQPLPAPADSLVTYDNGDAQVHHKRPVTPFQK